MFKNKFLLLLIAILAIASSGIWLFEITVVKGWHSLNWLSGTLFAPFICTFLAAIVYLSPFYLNKFTLKNILVSLVILYAVNLLCFFIGREICFLLYCRYCIWSASGLVILLLVALLVTFFLGFAYWYVTNKFLRKLSKKYVFFISLGVITSVPFSILTIHIYSGFGSQTGWVDAVKMGYPIFWCVLLLGLLGIKIAKTTVNYTHSEKLNS